MPFPCANPFWNNVAQAIEIVHCLDQALDNHGSVARRDRGGVGSDSNLGNEPGCTQFRPAVCNYTADYVHSRQESDGSAGKQTAYQSLVVCCRGAYYRAECVPSLPGLYRMTI